MAGNAYTFDFGAGRSPVCTIKVTVQSDQWDRLFAGVRKFAGLNDFDVRVTRLKPELDIVYIDVWKPDMAIAGENVFKPSDFALSLYIDPTKGATRDAALSAANRLRDELMEIPGASVELESPTD